jgi:hypothetical protein
LSIDEKDLLLRRVGMAQTGGGRSMEHKAVAAALVIEEAQEELAGDGPLDMGQVGPLLRAVVEVLQVQQVGADVEDEVPAAWAVAKGAADSA